MSLTTAEWNLLLLYHSGSVEETIIELRNALPCIEEPDTLAAAVNILRKLDAVSEEAFAALFAEHGEVQ